MKTTIGILALTCSRWCKLAGQQGVQVRQDRNHSIWHAAVHRSNNKAYSGYDIQHPRLCNCLTRLCTAGAYMLLCFCSQNSLYCPVG
jgi:hypothetical protein